MFPDTGSTGSDKPFFQVALNLPHAGRIARRILQQLPPKGIPGEPDEALARSLVIEMIELLDPSMEQDENPAPSLALPLRDKVAGIGRKVVDAIERGGLGHDRLGQCVRNLFECLELGREGADISLRAGENPRSMQRPF